MVNEIKFHGRYRVDRQLAVGGMGTVFCAADEKLNRTVAVKTLKDEFAKDPRLVQRFQREARAAAALSHPNIAAVFDYGEDQDTPFIVMEYVRGRDLARVLREDGPLPVDQAIAVVSAAADALAHAHAAGVVHRDVKPANIIVSDDGRVKVTDFGIARATGDATMTATGTMLGTANYISPEQARGDTVGPASDIYSLGILLYESLTGSVPFTADSPVGVALRHVNDAVPPPSRLNPEVPPELDAVVAKATAKSPEARFGSVAEMASVLRTGQAPPTDAGATAVLGGMGGTMLLDDGVPTVEQGQTVWPIPGNRWDPARLGRRVLVGFGALLLLAAGIMLWSAGANDAPREEPERRRRENAAAPETTTTLVTAPAEVTIPEVAGLHKDDAKAALEAEGFKPREEKVRPEDFDTDMPADLVITTDPAPGETAPPGSEVTMFVSEGPEEADEEQGEEESDEEAEDLPGNSEKAKGKGKG